MNSEHTHVKYAACTVHVCSSTGGGGGLGAFLLENI